MAATPAARFPFSHFFPPSVCTPFLIALCVLWPSWGFALFQTVGPHPWCEVSPPTKPYALCILFGAIQRWRLCQSARHM